MLYSALLPEIILALGSVGLLVCGVYIRPAQRASVWTNRVFFLLCAVVLYVLVVQPSVSVRNEFLQIDAYSRFLKVLILLGSALTLQMATAYNRAHGLYRFEFTVLIGLATVGMFVMVSAHNLITFYIGLELQSLAAYILATFNQRQSSSAEAGLKYFILGAVSSGILLYGCSFVYGFTGSTNFDAIRAFIETAGAGSGVFASPSGLPGAGTGPWTVGLAAGFLMILAGIGFKLAVVPFHMWAPDVYEGAPSSTVAYFAVAPKLAAMGLLVLVLGRPFQAWLPDIQIALQLVAIFSMVLGAFAGLVQKKLKRLLAYSAIGHMGYALMGLVAGTEAGVEAVLVYMVLYMTLSLGVFAALLSMKSRGGYFESIEDLAGLSGTRPVMALAILVLMLSLAGIPPLGGFFGKLYVFAAALQAGLYGLVIVGALTSVVAAFYYLRLIRLMYFEEPSLKFESAPPALSSLLIAMAGFNLLFFFFQDFLLTPAGLASFHLFRVPGI